MYEMQDERSGSVMCYRTGIGMGLVVYIILYGHIQSEEPCSSRLRDKTSDPSSLFKAPYE